MTNIDYTTYGLAANYLDGIADYIEEHGWHQGSEFGPDSSACLVGASNAVIRQIRSTIIPFSAVHIGVTALAETIGVPPSRLVSWNDEPHRTAEEVIKTIRVAAEKVRNP